MNASRLSLVLLSALTLFLPSCQKVDAERSEESHKIVVTSPDQRDVTSTQQFVCQIHSRRHIEVRALERGYLEEVAVNEGQSVKQGDLMFKIVQVLYQAKLDSEAAEAQLAQIELSNTKRLFDKNVVAQPEVALASAKLAKAQANMNLASAELRFTEIKAPFDGIIDRMHEQTGSLIEEGGILTTLSDNNVMWVYFNVPEAGYLEYKANMDADKVNGQEDDSARVELVLANGAKFEQTGMIKAIEADFNNETGNIAFRADFPNPDSLLRHGQTGTVLIHHVVKDAILIPQRASFEILEKRFVFVVGEDGVVHQREIAIQNEMEDIFIIKSGLNKEDKIVLEGVQQVRDGEQVEYAFRNPEEALSNLKYHAE